MKDILKKLAALSLPVLVWFVFFVVFEPNNYFGLKQSAASSQPVARVRAYEQSPGRSLIIGDSRLAHFDMALVNETSGAEWQNLAFGGASLKESLDLADYVLDSGSETDAILFELSFYTVNQNYSTDRFAALEDTLRNPLAYCLNLEYNVNALTRFSDWVKGTPDTVETGEWGAADYVDENGAAIPVHRKLYEYPALIRDKCTGWTANETELARLETLAARCQAEGVRLTVVLPPMAELVRTQICDPLGITDGMQPVLERLSAWADAYGFTVLDYEWGGGSGITDDDRQFYDGFHLDEVYGLPVWTEIVFSEWKEQNK